MANAARRLVICCDGTWNSPDMHKNGVPCPTNVAKVARAVLPEHEEQTQLTFYNVGVGAQDGWLKRQVAGATGLGLSGNLLDAYRYLIRTYAPGDELYLFGFSRGAFTVRSLAGMINNSGVLRPEHDGMVAKAFDIYRARTEASHPRAEEATLFRKTYAHQDITPIKFMGVWDTVGALGNPLLLMKGPWSRRYRFHDTGLSSTVEHAYQALAIDEKRRHFKAALWHQQPNATNQSLEQRWFVGVHANIGGGYTRTGLSDIALNWVARKAADCGLGLDHEKLAESPNAERMLKESRTGPYRLVPAYHRPIDHAENKRLQLANGTHAEWDTHERVDDSVDDFFREFPSYRPPELVDYYQRKESPLHEHDAARG